MMSSETVPKILSENIGIENTYATMSYWQKVLDDNMPKHATLTKGVRFNSFSSCVNCLTERMLFVFIASSLPYFPFPFLFNSNKKFLKYHSILDQSAHISSH